MVRFGVLCNCGTVFVPLRREDGFDPTGIRETYCPDCIDFTYPHLALVAKDIEKGEHLPQLLDFKTVCMFSDDFKGYFGVRFKTDAIKAYKTCVFDTPLLANTERVPLCLKRCQNVDYGKLVDNEDGCFPEQICRVHNKLVREVIRFKCEHYKCL